ncbi:hypothetical protein EV690_0902 [Celerinatantimonas diazotrophica]|uniref:Uncharacterized protein n=1 Tax=Celerinatantimonas diazotrophica TaxID=412034 RepID=A0A4R1K3T5_9GAMM|nr:hypothetical protein EV690_0902 [Celerinatantimonas diazotrophica]CAG9297389.1 hypothetical protein CEDIAZO_02570 [Celerinatantimonas diazotrophica]
MKAAFKFSSPSVQAVWHLKAMGLFLIGPVAGIILVQCIFGLPAFLWWSAGGMGGFMFTIWMILVLKERALIIKQTRHKCA